MNTSLLVAATMIAITVLAPAAPALANDDICGFSMQSRFVESAPRDSFVFSNGSNKPWFITSIGVDMAQSAGGLLFDTTSEGEGVEVFQPFRVSNGESTLSQATLRGVPTPKDGDQQILLNFARFAPGSSFTFTIDVDDQLTASELGQIRISGGEIAGSVVSVELQSPDDSTATLMGIYNNQNVAIISTDDC